MKKRYFASIIILTFCISMGHAQSVSFLNYFSDARTAAMGNAGYTLSSPFAVQRNTMAIMSAGTPSTGVAASYISWQPQVAGSSLINAAGYTKFKNMGLAIGIRSHSLDKIEKTDEQGNIKGTFTPSEYTAEFGLGYRIKANITLGASFRYIGSDMGGEKKASAIAADLSMLYNHQNLSIGLGCSNIGSKIDYGYSEYALPTRINTGVAYLFPLEKEHALTGVADIAYQLSSNYNGIASGMGAEYTYKNKFALRAGYHFESENVGTSYATAGCGIHLSGFSIDFAYMLASNNSPMRQTMLVSIKWESN